MKIKNYLKTMKTQFNKLNNESSNSKIIFTLGNISADMDSVMSSIFFAYFIFLKKGNENQNVFPIINTSENLLKCKLDITEVLKKLNISSKDLIYFENINFKKIENYELYIIDFNELDCEQTFLKNKIKGIIDHHKKTHDYKDLNFEIIKKRASAMTLLCEFYEDILDKNDFNDSKYALLAPLYLDSNIFSNNFYKNKFFDEDILLKNKILKKYNCDEKYFENLLNLKYNSNDINKIGFENLLLIDYKNYLFYQYKYGISVVINNLKKIQTYCGNSEEILKKIFDLMKKKNLMFYFLILYYPEDGKLVKEVIIFNNNIEKELFNKIIKELEQTNMNLQKKKKLLGEFPYFSINNLNITRKTFNPILQNIIKNLK